MDKRNFTDRNYGYDPEVDLQEVEQFGFVDLNSAFEKGIIPSFVPETDERFNGVSDPSTLLSRSDDVFDSIRKTDYVRDQLEHTKNQVIADNAASVAERVSVEVNAE